MPFATSWNHRIRPENGSGSSNNGKESNGNQDVTSVFRNRKSAEEGQPQMNAEDADKIHRPLRLRHGDTEKKMQCGGVLIPQRFFGGIGGNMLVILV